MTHETKNSVSISVRSVLGRYLVATWPVNSLHVSTHRVKYFLRNLVVRQFNSVVFPSAFYRHHPNVTTTFRHIFMSTLIHKKYFKHLHWSLCVPVCVCSEGSISMIRHYSLKHIEEYNEEIFVLQQVNLINIKQILVERIFCIQMWLFTKHYKH